MTITVIVEGDTEVAFKPILIRFLQSRLAGKIPMPKLRFLKMDGRIPKKDPLRKYVTRLLDDTKNPTDHVIALTDVYTGTRPPDFTDGDDACKKMRNWVGKESHFHPHACQYDFEAWLIPYWDRIQGIARHERGRPGGHAESINHTKPPKEHVKELFQAGGVRDYAPSRDPSLILKDQDLTIAARECRHLRLFLNTILTLSGGDEIPAS